MASISLNLLLADDDADDCMFFNEALKELPIDSSLKTVDDGEQLMNLLQANPERLPDILFLDLNMPRKTGYQCLSEIKLNDKLKQLPVIIYSTSLNHEVVNLLYDEGADHYIRKPGDFAKLKKVIFRALTIVPQKRTQKRSRDNFIIEA
jgi:CheY-like chemotaxis protein